jgi:SAM-dependent methyltransferase
MPLTVDPQARLFDSCADAYAQFRPTYPDAAIDTIISRWQLSPAALVCDLAAGTGALSYLFAARGFRVVAVEPLEEMRIRAARVACEGHWPIDVAAGIAEAIPLGDESVEAIVCGQAFHWFIADVALREMYRALKPGGGLALLWNNQDWQHVEWLGEIERLIEQYNPQHERNYRNKDWAGIVNTAGLFKPVEMFEFVMDAHPTTESMLGLVQSYSYVRIIPPERRRQLLDDIASLCEREQQGGRPLLLRYRTQLCLARK